MMSFLNKIIKILKKINLWFKKLFIKPIDEQIIKPESGFDDKSQIIPNNISEKKLDVEIYNKPNMATTVDFPIVPDIEIDVKPGIVQIIETKKSIKKKIKPKRSLSPSFSRKDKKDFSEEKIIERSEDIFDVIDLSVIPKKHQKIFTQEKKRKRLEKKERYRINTKRAQVFLDTNTSKIQLRLPIFSFPKYENFDYFTPICCIIEFKDHQDNIISKKVEIQDKHCKIGEYNETPQFLDIGIFKEINCKIQATFKKKIIKTFKYLHKDNSFYIFLDKNEKNPLIYNQNQFFNSTDKFWILLKNNMELIPEPSGSLDFIQYPNYNLYNVNYGSECYEIQIFDNINNKKTALYREPIIQLTPSENGLIFDELYYQEPIFSKKFYLNLQCSDYLKNTPKLVYIQNAITEEGFEQENFYKEIIWTEGTTFEVNPEVFENRMGNYQIDVEFYTAETFFEKISGKSIRVFFRYCPIKINFNDEHIFPSINGHREEKICIETDIQEKLLITCNEIVFLSKVFQKNGIIYREVSGIIPKDKDLVNLIISSKKNSNKIIAKPFIPRLKWRLTNIERFNNFTGKALELNIDKDFSIGKNINLEIRIISKDRIKNILLKYANKEKEIRIKDEYKFLYSYPLNSLYEEIIEYIRKNGELIMKIDFEGKQIPIIIITGKKEIFHEHKKPERRYKKRIKVPGEISKIHKTFNRELKIRGYINKQGNRVIWALITILSKKTHIKIKVVQDMFLNDFAFHKKFNDFLIVNNVFLKRGMKYDDFINRMAPNPYKKLEELLEFLENKNHKK